MWFKFRNNSEIIFFLENVYIATCACTKSETKGNTVLILCKKLAFIADKLVNCLQLFKKTLFFTSLSLIYAFIYFYKEKRRPIVSFVLN